MDISYTKISTKIWRVVLDKLDQKLELACLRRDAFLNRVLETELPQLDAEVSLPNSDGARAFIAKRLDELDRKLVSLSLRTELVQQLDKICAEKLIVRDAFFNRLLLLLAATPNFIDHVFFPGLPRWRTEIWSEYKHEGPFFDRVFNPLETDINPFWAIRAGRQHFNDTTEQVDHVDAATGKTVQVIKDVLTDGVELPRHIYTVPLDNNTLKSVDLHGLNCYLADWRVPGEPEAIARGQALDTILAEL